MSVGAALASNSRTRLPPPGSRRLYVHIRPTTTTVEPAVCPGAPFPTVAGAGPAVNLRLPSTGATRPGTASARGPRRLLSSHEPTRPEVCRGLTVAGLTSMGTRSCREPEDWRWISVGSTITPKANPSRLPCFFAEACGSRGFVRSLAAFVDQPTAPFWPAFRSFARARLSWSAGSLWVKCASRQNPPLRK